MRLQRNVRELWTAVAAALVLSGCFTVRYTTGQNPGGSRHEESASFFLWGLVGDKRVDLDSICPQGVARWQNQATFLDGFLAVVTLGIYSPRTVVVECTGGRAYRMTPDQKRRLVAEAGSDLGEQEGGDR